MQCRRIQNKLSEYLDGELSPAERSQVQAHLQGCADCRAEAAALRRTAMMARDLGGFEPPPTLAYRLDPAIIAQRAAAPEPVSWGARLRGILVPAGSFATVAASLALAISIMGRPPVPISPAGNAPANVANGTGPSYVQQNATVMADGHKASPAVAPPAGEPNSKPAPDKERVAERSAPVVHERRIARRNEEPAASPRPSVTSGRRYRPERIEPGAVVAANSTESKPVRRAVEPLKVADTLKEHGRYAEAVDVMNKAFERSARRCSMEKRSLYQEQNDWADSDINECVTALAADPGNKKARQFLEKAYNNKKAILLSLNQS